MVCKLLCGGYQTSSVCEAPGRHLKILTGKDVASMCYDSDQMNGFCVSLCSGCVIQSDSCCLGVGLTVVNERQMFVAADAVGECGTRLAGSVVATIVTLYSERAMHLAQLQTPGCSSSRGSRFELLITNVVKVLNVLFRNATCKPQCHDDLHFTFNICWAFSVYA